MSAIISGIPAAPSAPVPIPVNEEATHHPIVSPPTPIYLKIVYFLSIWTFKILLNTALFLSHHLVPPASGQLKPIIKTYPIRPTLKNRIFIPPSSIQALTTPVNELQEQQEQLYPVYISLHGGGWAGASPYSDDEFCSYLCQRQNILVISLDYRKSPKFQFPFAITDVSSLVLAILSDRTLPIDTNKIAIGGFSAGGNLAFAACQTDELIGNISAVVGFYPVLDLTESKEVKESRRPSGKGVPRDGVAWSAEFLDWGYVPQGQDRRDPWLSPRFAKQEKLPKWCYLVGAEWDMLCWEAPVTAEELVGEGDEKREVRGEGWEGWESGGVRWECFKARSHAFTHAQEWNGKKEEERVRVVEEMYDRVGRWLIEEVWGK